VTTLSRDFGNRDHQKNNSRYEDFCYTISLEMVFMWWYFAGSCLYNRCCLVLHNVECRLTTIFRHSKDKARFIVELFWHYVYCPNIMKLLRIFVDISIKFLDLFCSRLRSRCEEWQSDTSYPSCVRMNVWDSHEKDFHKISYLRNSETCQLFPILGNPYKYVRSFT
jgi:hypothetical protein